MRTILLRFCYLLLAALMICVTASVAVPFPTNMDLLVETVGSAVDESLARETGRIRDAALRVDRRRAMKTRHRRT